MTKPAVTIEGKATGKLDIKRFYLPGVVVKSACPKCGEVCTRDLKSRNYLSHPIIDQPTNLYGYCDACGHEWEMMVVLRVALEAMSSQRNSISCARDSVVAAAREYVKVGRVTWTEGLVAAVLALEGACVVSTARKLTPVLRAGAVYWADGGATICIDCAGMSAKFTGRDLSGQKVRRVSVADVRSWEAEPDLPPLRCECRRVVLSSTAGPDGWPATRAPACGSCHVALRAGERDHCAMCIRETPGLLLGLSGTGGER